MESEVKSIRFKPRAVPTLAAFFFIALTVSLGNWQSGKAANSERLRQDGLAPVLVLPASKVDPAAVARRKVQASGRFLNEWTLLLDNRVHRGVPGYHVLTPLLLGDPASGMAVLVNRGWVAAGTSRARLPVIAPVTGTVQIEGVASVPLATPYALAEDRQQGPVRQNVELQRIESEIRIALQPVVVQQTSPAPDGLVRDWPEPADRVDMHRAYAFQWYVMAMVILGLWVGLNLKRREQTRE